MIKTARLLRRNSQIFLLHSQLTGQIKNRVDDFTTLLYFIPTLFPIITIFQHVQTRILLIFAPHNFFTQKIPYQVLLIKLVKMTSVQSKPQQKLRYLLPQTQLRPIITTNITFKRNMYIIFLA